MIIILNGCGSKHTDTPPLTVAEPQENIRDDQLTSTEITAFKSTGQIDHGMSEDALRDIAQEYKRYLRDGRTTVCAFSKRSEPYLAYVRKVFKEKGLPEELANLAIVESGYKSNAISKAGAAGTWQFMPETGLKYGLAQDWWQDERLDPYKATEAAANYLKKLYDDFGDWPTAIAAYNAGEGKMSRAKEGTGGKDFFEVKALNHMLDDKNQLREETKQYVPRFLAVSKIMRNLPALGFDPIEPEKAEEVTQLKVAPGTDLKALSRACNLDWADFYARNQHHRRTITCTDKETFVYVPKKVSGMASTFLCTDQAANYAGWKPTRVASAKDSLEKISKRSNIPLARLQNANPGLSKLKAGQIILIPSSINMSQKAVAAVSERGALKLDEAKKRVEAAQAKAAGKNAGVHVIQPSETLFSIARKYNVDVKVLMAHNNISNPGMLKLGQQLKIPGKTVQGSKGSIGKRQCYIVKAKDNLWSIARKHCVSVEDIKRWNNISENNIKVGLSLIVAEE